MVDGGESTREQPEHHKFFNLYALREMEANLSPLVSYSRPVARILVRAWYRRWYRWMEKMVANERNNFFVGVDEFSTIALYNRTISDKKERSVVIFQTPSMVERKR